MCSLSPLSKWNIAETKSLAWPTLASPSAPAHLQHVMCLFHSLMTELLPMGVSYLNHIHDELNHQNLIFHSALLHARHFPAALQFGRLV